MADPLTKAPSVPRPSPAARGFWLRQFRQWHWVSAAISLVGMLLFAVTGLTLNNAALFASRPVTVETQFDLPAALLPQIAALPEAGDAALPEPVQDWAAKTLRLALADRPLELSPDEVYIALPTPGGDGWLAIDRTSGAVTHSSSDGGWLAYLNDLHKGRNAGPVWGWFINILAMACIVFTLTGLGLLWHHAKLRPATWPLGWASLAIPVIIALLFVH